MKTLKIQATYIGQNIDNILVQAKTVDEVDYSKVYPSENLMSPGIEIQVSDTVDKVVLSSSGSDVCSSSEEYTFPVS